MTLSRCCERCFNDADIKARITDIGDKGNCDFCKSKNVNTLDINKALSDQEYSKNIINDFKDVLELYVIYDDIDNLDYSDKAHRLGDQLEGNTNIFGLKSEMITKLLKTMFPDYYNKSRDLFDSLVIPKYLLDKSLEKSSGIFKGETWSHFENEIKYVNRFHSNLANDNILKVFFGNLSINLKKGVSFYRARISDSGKVISNDNMGAAPNGKATSGRLNASGIGYLYLCQKYEIAIAEIKGSLNDLCTVAKFETSQEIEVVDLSQITELSIFSFSDNKETYLMNYEILRQLDSAMSKISGKDRSEVEYVPTEYISDLIKEAGFEGILYTSTIDGMTKDLVLFENLKVELQEDETKSYRIEMINYPKLQEV